jgi:hypothetical protein
MQRQELQDELREVEVEIQELLSLMREKPEVLDENLEKARKKRNKFLGDKTTAYVLERKKGCVATTMHTHTHLALGDILKTKIKLCQYTESLEDTLRRLSERRVELLEAILSTHSGDEQE